ncbi:MAG: iron ABC transporter permease [Rhizobiaceae bacterium]|nr:iron ABC transporter permease [Rhizobiaceae bacterium]
MSISIDSVKGDLVREPKRKRLDGDRSAIARVSILILAGALLVAMFASLTTGSSNASALAVVKYWLGIAGGENAMTTLDSIVINDIRMPRMILGSLVGASLAVSGAIMQGLFRNPLADPGLIGVSAGAGLGAVSIIVLGGTTLAPLTGFLGIYALPLSAFFGALASTMLLYKIATRHGQTSIATMLLAGIALGALAGALTGIFVYIADDAQLRDLTFWGMGSLAGSSWDKIWAAGPIIVVALVATPFLARGLNGLALGEATANHLGIPVQTFKNIAIVTVAAATGASVAVSGGIGFIGIVVPHLLRLVIGPDHRYLLPASALLGAIMLLFADAISRTVVAPAELPIGIITAVGGAPFFLWILLHRRGMLGM